MNLYTLSVTVGYQRFRRYGCVHVQTIILLYLSETLQNAYMKQKDAYIQLGTPVP